MEIIEENQDGINIYKLNGHLDFNTSLGFENKLIQAIDGGSKSVIKEVFEISGFDSLLPIVGSMGDALDAFSPNLGLTDKIKRD